MEIRQSNGSVSSENNPKSSKTKKVSKSKVPSLKVMMLDPDVRAFLELIRDNQSVHFREKAVALLEKRIAALPN